MSERLNECKAPIPLTMRSKAWVCGLWVAGIAGSNLAGAGCLSRVSVVSCQVGVSATGRSLVQRSPTDFGVSWCDLETSKMRGRRPTRAVER